MSAARTVGVGVVIGVVGAVSGCGVPFFDQLNDLGLSCGDDVTLIDRELRPPQNGGDVVVTAASVEDGFVSISFADNDGNINDDDDSVLRFVVDSGRPPALPPTGPGTLFVGSASCFGEGCDLSWWSMRDDAGVPWFEVGRAIDLDGNGSTGPAANDHFDVAAFDEDACAGGVVHADDGDVEVASGDTVEVDVVGAASVVIAGHAGSARFTQVGNDCADCAGKGTHTSSSMEVVLYRRAP